MTMSLKAYWHKESFARFLNTYLPEMLADNIPLSGYDVRDNNGHSCTISVMISHEDHDLRLDFPNIPQPDEEGIFHINGQEIVVPPLVSSEHLDQADVFCVGERLSQAIEHQISRAPDDFAWTEELFAAWIPLQDWVMGFFQEHGQVLDDMNWSTRKTHPQRIVILDWEAVWTKHHRGRVCLVESPQGPNVGKIFTIARGAAIENKKIVIKETTPKNLLGIGAAMLPFLEHNEPARLLTAANRMRQWLQPLEAEPAIVQTGNEPDTPEFWCGRNLLTAFTSVGQDTFEDALVLSESAAARFVYSDQVEVGDLLTNRHGQHGIISKILPDAEMPHLPDGTCVELLVSFVGLHTRMNIGQLLEAAVSWIGHIEDKPVVIAPWQAPSREEIQEQLEAKGLSPTGMYTLQDGKTGQKFSYPTTVGWVYWGRTRHRAEEKLRFGTTQGEYQMQGEWEYYALKQAGGFKNLHERITISSIRSDEVATLAERITQGSIDTESKPSPYFMELQKRLACVGIHMDLVGEQVRFTRKAINGKSLKLAKPLPHPWQFGKFITKVGCCEPIPSFSGLEKTNRKLKQMLSTTTPESLIASTQQQLEKQLAVYFQELLQPKHLRIHDRICFSGRTVLAPGESLTLSQIGLPEDMVWALYEPFILRELDNREAVAHRTPKALQVLQKILKNSWVLLNRAPSISPTSIVAFQPVMLPEKIIRIHPLVCRWLNADFDGDQGAVILPLTRSAQEEAREKLSIKGHLQRDPTLLATLLPNHESLVGLAYLSLDEEGKQKLEELLEQAIRFPGACLTQDNLYGLVKAYFRKHGSDRTLDMLEQLDRLGFEEVAKLGLSMSPFIGQMVTIPAPDAQADASEITRYCDQLCEFFESSQDFGNFDFGPQVLTIKSGARGSIKHLVALIGNRNALVEIADKRNILKHAHIHGITPDELEIYTIQFRKKLLELFLETEHLQDSIRTNNYSKGFHVFARAFRAKNPGMVFVHAAENEEIDPLVDIDARLFVDLACAIA